MPVSIHHVQKVSLGFKRKYRISSDNGTGKPGAVIGYAQKALKVSDELTIYGDEQRAEKLVSVRESSKGWLASMTGYEAFDGKGLLLGSFGVLVRKSLDRTTWQFDQPGLGRFIGIERSAKTARARRLLGLGGTAGEIAGALVKYHFDFTREDARDGAGDGAGDEAGDGAGDAEIAFSIEKPKVLDDWYKLTVHDDALDLHLLFALTVTMEARQRG